MSAKNSSVSSLKAQWDSTKPCKTRGWQLRKRFTKLAVQSDNRAQLDLRLRIQKV